MLDRVHSQTAAVRGANWIKTPEQMEKSYREVHYLYRALPARSARRCDPPPRTGAKHMRRHRQISGNIIGDERRRSVLVAGGGRGRGGARLGRGAERALAGRARKRSAVSTGLYRDALAVMTASDRIPYPAFLGDRLANFWQDERISAGCGADQPRLVSDARAGMADAARHRCAVRRRRAQLGVPRRRIPLRPEYRRCSCQPVGRRQGRRRDCASSTSRPRDSSKADSSCPRASRAPSGSTTTR